METKYNNKNTSQIQECSQKRTQKKTNCGAKKPWFPSWPREVMTI